MDPAWGFGYVYTHQRLACTCGAPVYELVFCNECNTGHLKARRDDLKLVQAGQDEADEYLVDLETADTDDSQADVYQRPESVIIGQQPHDEYTESFIDPTGKLSDTKTADTTRIYWNQQAELCTACI